MHVCRRWRQVVFESPLRLDLRIFCTSRTPVGRYLGIWPALPIIIDLDYQSDRRGNNNEDNIITALEHVDRVCSVRLRATDSELKNITTVMQAPYPVLTNLFMDSKDGNAPVFPAEFLGGSAPRLQRIYLDGIPFPTLPTLLLSTSDLVALHLHNIPPTGLIPPVAMVVGLAALPRLKTFIIQFRSASPRPDRIHSSPVTRTVLPALTFFQFQGASEYLEDLVARIDAPQLDRIHITYLNQLVDFRVPQFPMFIDRSVGPKLTQHRYAQVAFRSHRVTFRTYRDAGDPDRDEPDAITDVRCQGFDWQVSHIAQVLSHFIATLSHILYLKFPVESPLEGTNDIELLRLLYQFPTVQTLFVPYTLAQHFALALESTALDTVAEALPSLVLIFLGGLPADYITKFVAARLLSGRPVTVVHTHKEFSKRLKSYVK